MNQDITLTIGRGSDRHIRFDDNTVSCKHAKLTIRRDGRYLLEDDGSSHGTVVSGRKISGAHPLSATDVIEFGHVRISAQDLQRKAAEAYRRLQQTKPVQVQVQVQPQPNPQDWERQRELERQLEWERQRRVELEQQNRQQHDRQPPAAGPMTFGQAIATCFNHKYATFSGRARRAEFWWFYLFNVLVNLGLGIVFIPIVMLGGVGGALFCNIISLLCSITFFLPNLAVAVRRLHDRNISGWWLLLGSIPALIGAVVVGIGFAVESEPVSIIGVCVASGFFVIEFIVFLIMLLLRGTDGPNHYGPDPLAEASPGYASPDRYYDRYNEPLT